MCLKKMWNVSKNMNCVFKNCELCLGKYELWFVSRKMWNVCNEMGIVSK